MSHKKLRNRMGMGMGMELKLKLKLKINSNSCNNEFSVHLFYFFRNWIWFLFFLFRFVKRKSDALSLFIRFFSPFRSDLHNLTSIPGNFTTETQFKSNVNFEMRLILSMTLSYSYRDFFFHFPFWWFLL